MSFAVSGAIVGAAVIGGLVQSNAAQSAANTEANAANAATSEQEAMFGQEQANMKPYLNAGYTALGQLNQEMPGWNAAATPTVSQVESTPGYQFGLQQTEAEAGNLASAQGATYGSGTSAAMQGYAQQVAQQGYNNAFSNYQTSINNAYSRLAGVANMGLGGAQSLNSNATTVAGNVGNNITSAGTASAAGTIGSANAINSSLGTATNGLMYNNMISTLAQNNTQNANVPNSNTPLTNSDAAGLGPGNMNPFANPYAPPPTTTSSTNTGSTISQLT